jgi:hypothetical protein
VCPAMLAAAPTAAAAAAAATVHLATTGKGLQTLESCQICKHAGKAPAAAA